MRRSARRQSGYALMLALAMIGLIAVAVAAASAAFAAQARHTRATNTDAQLRQLLLAGAREAQQRIGQDAPADVALPPALAELGATLRVEPRDQRGKEPAFHIVATISGRRAEQTVTFTRDGDTWRLTRAERR